MTHNKKEAHLPSAAASAGPSAATSGSISTVRGFPRSSMDRQRYALARSRIAIAGGRRFHAQYRRVDASPLPTSRCIPPPTITARAAGAAPTPVAPPGTLSGAAWLTILPSGRSHRPGACTRYALQKYVYFNALSRPQNGRYATIISYLAPDMDVTIKWMRGMHGGGGGRKYRGFLFATGKITGTIEIGRE